MNRIIMQFASGQIDLPITEDFQIETATEFSTFGDLCPTISSLVDVGNMLSSSGGTVGSTGLGLRSILDAPRWTKTNPVKITVDMFFYTKTDPLTDVLDPMTLLIGSHILRTGDKKQVLVPGLNAKNVRSIDQEIKDIKDKGGEEITDQQKKEMQKIIDQQQDSIFSVVIPGVIYLPAAFVFSVSPTYSKHVTENGYPLWASANVQIQSLVPAFIEFFKMGRLFDTNGNYYGPEAPAAPVKTNPRMR